jgi:hypothetical protein
MLTKRRRLLEDKDEDDGGEMEMERTMQRARK